MHVGTLCCFVDRYQPGYGQGGLLYTYQMDEDISEFQLVDTSKPQKVSTYKNKQKIQVSASHHFVGIMGNCGIKILILIFHLCGFIDGFVSHV